MNRIGSEGRGIWLVRLPARSPNLDTNDLGYFAPSKIRIWRVRLGRTELLRKFRVPRLLGKHDSETLERVWQSLLKKYKQVLAGLGGIDFEV